MSLTRARRWRALLTATMVIALLAPSAADAALRSIDRDDLVERQRALIAELDALAASNEELATAIATLDDYIAIKSGEVAAAQDLLAQATVALEAARVAEEQKRAEVADLERRMAEMAVAAYVAPPQADQMQTMLSASAPSDAASLDVYLDVQNGRDTDIVRRLRVARAQLTGEREQAELAEDRAEDARDRAVQELDDLVTAREQQVQLREEVLARTEAADFESRLIALDLAREREALVDAARAQQAGVPLVSVGTFRVHRSIAAQLDALLAAASADGIELGGGGFRDSSQQISLRQAHCGTDHYSVWEKPAGECSPPTARPGTSLHELGLALDFTYNGSTISSRTSPAFKWLDENAHRFGFYNLPSEPWHWSVNGN